MRRFCRMGGKPRCSNHPSHIRSNSPRRLVLILIIDTHRPHSAHSRNPCVRAERRTEFTRIARRFICSNVGLCLSLNSLHSYTANGTRKLGSPRMQMTSKSDSRYPVTNWPQLHRLQRCWLPTGVPFFTLSLPMTLSFLSGRAGGFSAGEQTGTVLICPTH